MRRKFVFLLTLLFVTSLAFSAQYDYNPSDSPSPYDYDSDTYDELGWTEIAVTQTDDVTDVVVDYTWDTDSWAYEGSFWLESPLGTSVEFASGESDGTYNHTITDFSGEAMNGTWILWIEDSFGDGGHQATEITVEFHYAQAGAPGLPSNPNPADGATDVALDGTLTWDFGADTDTYDLWFGEAGNMTEVVNGATAGATGSYSYSGLNGDSVYEWQVIAHNSSRATTNGPTWSFKTALPAGVVQVGNGTATGQHLPIEPFYGYSYSQSIYLASDFGSPGSDKRIEKLWYNYSWNGGDAGSDTWTVYMDTTTDTDLDGGYLDISTFTQVFSGDVDLELVSGDGWIEIILDTPFAYDPSSDGNLVVAVDENAPSYTSSSDEFYCDQDTRANVSRYYFSDGTNPDPASPPAGYASSYYPNTRFLFDDIPAIPVFDVNPTSKDYGIVNVGTTSATESFMISNVGGGTLTITDVSLTGTDIDQFVLTDGNSYPHDLGAGESITVDVAFSPDSEGAKSANLTITDSRATTDVALSGTGYNATVTTFPWVEDFSDSSTPTDWTNDGTKSWLFSTGAAYGAASAGDHTTGGGTNYAWIDGSGGISDNQLVTPPLDPATLTEPILSFWYFSNNTNAPGDNNTLYCDMNIDGGGWARANIFTYSGDNSEWQNEIIDLSGYSYTNNIQFRFWVEETPTGSAYYNDILIDDVEVKEAPAVLPPANLSTTDIGIVHATFNWDAASGATYYEVRWGLDGFDVETGPYNDATEISGTSIEVSELTPDTAYDWYVRGDDGMGRATSAWSSVASFTSHDGVAANPTPADGAGNIDITSTTLDWDDIYDASEYFITIGTTSGGNDVVDSVSTGTNSEYTYGSDWSNSTTYYWTVYTEYDDNMGRGGMKERASSRGFQVVTGDEWQFSTTFEAVTSYPYFIDFETGAIPGGWSEIYEIGTHSWNYQDGGYSANPSNAYNGSYNAAYTHESRGDITKLVTRPLDLSSVNNPQLEFVHAQLVWAGDQDELRVYYRTSSGGSWNLLAEYTTSLDWTTRMMSLPNPSADYYLAFEATDDYGYGVCLDDVKVYGGESYSQPPAPGGTAYNFDGGSGAGGSTVTLDPTTAGGDVIITQYDDPPGTLPFPENALDLWFDIDGSSFSGDFPVDVTIEWEAPAPVGTSSPVLLVSLDGSSWTNVLDDAGVTDVIWDLEAPAPYSVSFTTDHFSMWALGNGDDDPLPVTLTNFSAAYFQNEFVSVSWTTESETEMNCYNLYRSEDGSEGQFLIYSENAKNTTSTHNYEYQDHEVENGVTYQYWLEAVGNDGSTTEYGPTSVTVQGEEAPELPDATLLYGNYPNPFNPDTRIKFDIKEGETAELTIYNIRGAVVTTEKFSANEENAGRITYQWDASEYSSGVYFYRLRTESYTEVKKMLMLK